MENKNLEQINFLFMSTQIADQIKINKMILDIGMRLAYRYTETVKIRTPYEQDGLMLFQMTLMKSASILKLTEGISFKSSTVDLKMENIYDPQTALAITRCQYEAFSNFNNIYIQSKTEAELQLKYHLWVKVGLNYRQKYNNENFKKYTGDNPEYNILYNHAKEKKEKERVEIEELKVLIQNNVCFLNLTPKSKQLITNNWNNEWKFKIDNEIAYRLNWTEIIKLSIKNSLVDDQYNYLSSNNHPSNLSVFQFAGMHENELDSSTMKTALTWSNFYLSFFISDFFQYFKLEAFFKELPDEHRLLLNTYNKMFRT